MTPRSASAGWACEASQAGAKPKTIPVSIVMRKAKPSTGSDGVASMGMYFESGNARARIMRDPE